MHALPVQPHSLSIALTDKLRERILSHQLPPGCDINEGQLAQEFGISRTPVREAMKLLCHEGLLTALPRRGMKVTLMSHAEIHEAQQVCLRLQELFEQQKHACPQATFPLTQHLLGIAKARLQLALGPAAASSLSVQPAGYAAVPAPAHQASHPGALTC